MKAIKTAPGVDNPFDDVCESDYFYNAVLWAYENGVTGGVGNDLFAPDSGAKRAEVATFIYRALNPSEKPVEPVEPVEPTEPVEPVEPVEPTAPVEPMEPVEPTVSPEPEGELTADS